MKEPCPHGLKERRMCNKCLRADVAGLIEKTKRLEAENKALGDVIRTIRDGESKVLKAVAALQATPEETEKP